MKRCDGCKAILPKVVEVCRVCNRVDCHRRHALRYVWFRVLLKMPDGPKWPIWYSRGLEWIAIHTTPADGF